MALLLITTSCTKDVGHEQDDIQILFVEDNDNVETTVKPSDLEQQLFSKINDHRAQIDLAPFAFNEVTYLEAAKHNDYMISKGHRSHANFAKRASLIAEKVGAEFVAENLASDYQNIDDAFDDWLESSGHRKNIEGNFTHSGVSVKADAAGALYFTQIFFR